MLSFHSKLFKITHCRVLQPVPTADVRLWQEPLPAKNMVGSEIWHYGFYVFFWQRFYLLSDCSLLRYKGKINSDYFTEILFT